MTTASTETQGPKSSSRRKKKWIIIAVVLIGLLVLVDFIAATAAEYQVSKKAREQFKLQDDPSVTVHGFPFLTQAISGTYGEISVSAAGVPVADTLRELEINADLRQVHAPLSDLLSGNTKTIQIDEVEGVVKIKATDVGRAVGLPDLSIAPTSERRVRIPEDEDDQDDADAQESEVEDTTAGVRLDASPQIAGEKTDISVFAMLTLAGNKIDVNPQRIELRNGVANIVVPSFIQDQIFKRFSIDLRPGSLPFRVTPTAVSVEEGALMLKGKAADVKMAN